MLRPDFSTPGLSPTQWSTAVAPARQTDTDSFSASFRQVHAEIKQVIDSGWESTPGSALSIEGQVRRSNLGLTAELSLDQPMDQKRQAFLASIAPWAKEAGSKLGVSPDIIAAHAALESGWGEKPLKDAQGQNMHNLFGIKAQKDYKGESAQSLTTEYEDGMAIRKDESFRRYPDYASAFHDYARMLKDSPRYRDALNAGDNATVFAQALTRGGYATDPDYAAKLTSVLRRIQSAD